MNLLRFFAENRQQILELTLEHLWLVGISTLLAVVVGHTAGNHERSLARMEQAGAGDRKHYSDHSEPRALWFFASGAVAGRSRRSIGDSGAHSLRVAARDSQYVYRHSWRRSGSGRSWPRAWG